MNEFWEKQYEILKDRLIAKGLDPQSIIVHLKKQVIELPSWAVGDSGTRYGVFQKAGSARNIWDKIDDCAEINKHVGISPVMASHALWDRPENGNFSEVKNYALDRGLRIGTMHPNTFIGQQFKLGGVCNPDPSIRESTIDHFCECVDIAEEVGSKVIGMWIADGTNYPGQDHLRTRMNLLEEGLRKLYDALRNDIYMVLEYKFFEPGFYTMDVMDWGMSLLMCNRLGPKAKVLVDLGHHAQSVNVEQIVAILIDEEKIGGFHLNNRRYADDDLISGSTHPLELFLVFDQIVDGLQDPSKAKVADEIVYMLDESHNIEPSIEGVIHSIVNTQKAYCKALIVDRKNLRVAQQSGDVLKANKIIMDAFDTDVRPILAKMRTEIGVDPDPVESFRRSGYQEKIAKERGFSGTGTLGG